MILHTYRNLLYLLSPSTASHWSLLRTALRFSSFRAFPASGGSFLSILPLASCVVVADLVFPTFPTLCRHPVRVSAGLVRCSQSPLLPLSCLRRHVTNILLQPPTLRVPRLLRQVLRQLAIRRALGCALCSHLLTICFCPLSCLILVLRCHELQVLQQERSLRSGSPCCSTSMSNGCRISR